MIEINESHFSFRNNNQLFADLWNCYGGCIRSIDLNSDSFVRIQVRQLGNDKLYVKFQLKDEDKKKWYKLLSSFSFYKHNKDICLNLKISSFKFHVNIGDEISKQIYVSWKTLPPTSIHYWVYLQAFMNAYTNQSKERILIKIAHAMGIKRCTLIKVAPPEHSTNHLCETYRFLHNVQGDGKCFYYALHLAVKEWAKLKQVNIEMNVDKWIKELQKILVVIFKENFEFLRDFLDKKDNLLHTEVSSYEKSFYNRQGDCIVGSMAATYLNANICIYANAGLKAVLHPLYHLKLKKRNPNWPCWNLYLYYTGTGDYGHYQFLGICPFV